MDSLPSLQCANGVDFSNVDDGTHSLECRTAALADFAIAAYKSLFTAEHNVGRSLQTCERKETRVMEYLAFIQSRVLEDLNYFAKIPDPFNIIRFHIQESGE